MASSSASTPWVIIGAGFAGASTAWALARAGAGQGIILEREFAYGAHASGRNAGLVRLAEDNPVIRALAVRSLAQLRAFEHDGKPVMQSTGGVTVARRAETSAVAERHDSMRDAGLDVSILQAPDAKTRFPFLSAFDFDVALWCPAEGVVDIHALLTMYLEQAKHAGAILKPRSAVDEIIVDGGRVKGVRIGDQEIRAEVVVDASGAWAGTLGRSQPLPLQPFRRHLCVTGSTGAWTRDAPYVWVWENEFYCRPESDGLLMSPCDATLSSPSALSTDAALGDLLAAKLAEHAPGLLEVPLRRSWACLRTFAPDRLPLIGPDPALPGLFHVSGLGGFGMMTSAAIGEAAAAAILGRELEWMDLASVAVTRLQMAGEHRG